jgi:hypothetical protein
MTMYISYYSLMYNFSYLNRIMYKKMKMNIISVNKTVNIMKCLKCKSNMNCTKNICKAFSHYLTKNVLYIKLSFFLFCFTKIKHNNIYNAYRTFLLFLFMIFFKLVQFVYFRFSLFFFTIIFSNTFFYIFFIFLLLMYIYNIIYALIETSIKFFLSSETRSRHKAMTKDQLIAKKQYSKPFVKKATSKQARLSLQYIK